MTQPLLSPNFHQPLCFQRLVILLAFRRRLYSVKLVFSRLQVKKSFEAQFTEQGDTTKQIQIENATVLA